MSNMDDEQLMVYLDGELDELSRARVKQALADDAGLRGRLEAQQRLRDRLAAHYGPVEQEEVPDRLRAMLENPVANLAAARAQREQRPRPLWQSFAAIAATLVFGLLLGRSLSVDGGPIAIEDGVMVAQGALADALDAQLASAQPADAATRIGVSFGSVDGRLCRTFESAAMAGLACHGPEGWQVVMTAPGARTPPQGEYRQAGGTSAAFTQAAQEMMAGEPLDAEAERRARDRGWRNVSTAD